MRQHHVGPARLGTDVKLMHGGNDLAELFSHESPSASSLEDIARLAPLQSEVGRTINKDTQIKEMADRGSPEQPEAFDQNERGWLPNDALRKTGVRLEIVAREARWPAGARGHDPFLKQGPINCPRMIKVN